MLHAVCCFCINFSLWCNAAKFMLREDYGACAINMLWLRSDAAQLLCKAALLLSHQQIEIGDSNFDEKNSTTSASCLD